MATGGKPSAGCWTCKLRRKKCDGALPTCSACTTLQITCHFEKIKPEWMNGGMRQEEMAKLVRNQIKENGHRRRAGRAVGSAIRSSPPNKGKVTAERSGEWHVFSKDTPQSMGIISSPDDPTATVPWGHAEMPNVQQLPIRPSEASQSSGKGDCALARQAGLASQSLGRDGVSLIMFYLETLFPFLFPFYQPSVQQGGRAWILDLLLKSPVVRQAMLCQSSYYLSLAQRNMDHTEAWDVVLAQTRDVFSLLGQTVRIIDSEGIAGHIHGAARTLASIVQLQRFEVAISSFGNCQAHLSACISLFRQLLGVGQAETGGLSCPSSCFANVVDLLGSKSGTISGMTSQTSSSEQDAFRFSAALVVFDDIIASTALQEPPQLYYLHRSLLASETSVDLEATLGCSNWIMIEIGEISALNAWKEECKKSGSLDIVELVQRAMAIKSSIENNLALLERPPTTVQQETNLLLDALSTGSSPTTNLRSQILLVTRIWAHAALLYLSVVVSGWQPANCEVRINVQQTLDLLNQLSPSALLRTACWPLCVASCLAEPWQEVEFRNLVQGLQPQSAFGTLYRALEVMENCWRRRDVLTPEHDLAASFRWQDDLVLLV